MTSFKLAFSSHLFSRVILVFNGAQPFCYCRPQYKVSFNLRQPSSQEKLGTFLLSPHHLLPVIFLVKLTRNSPPTSFFLFHPSAGVSNLFEPRAILTHKKYWRAIQRKHLTFCTKIIVICKKKGLHLKSVSDLLLFAAPKNTVRATQNLYAGQT